MTNQLFEVFARKDRKDPLTHVGTVSAVNELFAKVYARNTYDEENWIQMIVVPRSAIIPALEIEPLIDVPATGD